MFVITFVLFRIAVTTPRSGWTWSFLPRPPFRTEDAFALWGFAIIRGEMKAHWRVWAGAVNRVLVAYPEADLPE